MAFNAIAANPVLKIHPSIGVARVGDSPTGFFIGPERPFAGNTGTDADAPAASAVPPFRAGGAIKRQAARFRIYHYPVGKDPEELNLAHPDVAEIEWTVHLANRKAAFFEFKGQTGAAGLGTGSPFSGAAPPLRNASIPTADRNTKLVIDPGPKSIKSGNAGPVKFDSTSGNWPKDVAGTPVLDYLGELRTDSKGRLLVLGGRGKAVSSNALPPKSGPGSQMAALAAQGYAGPPVGAARPPAPMLTYANNDTWFDDVSDGPVTAKVKLKSGRTITVQAPGWVMVGPPDFVPEMRSVVSLYDAVLDVAIRELPAPTAPFYTAAELTDYLAVKSSFGGTPGFTPKFFPDIGPMLEAAAQSKFVHSPALGAHGTIDLTNLKAPNPAMASLRSFVFGILRPPAGDTNYAHMPKLFGDKYDVPADPKRVLAVTELQYHLLKLWKAGTFVAGTPGPPAAVTPSSLDRAGLESCVGGAFFPGIECSWLIRDKRLYSEPFRIKHGVSIGSLTVGPGFFSQQMALPWHSDFLDCRKSGTVVGTAASPNWHGWWPAQRPDDVFKTAADASAATGMVDWARGIPSTVVPRPAGADHARMVLLWNQLGFVVSATVAGNKVFFEQERALP
jgi:hypothetical protein